MAQPWQATDCVDRGERAMNDKGGGRGPISGTKRGNSLRGGESEHPEAWEGGRLRTGAEKRVSLM